MIATLLLDWTAIFIAINSVVLAYNAWSQKRDKAKNEAATIEGARVAEADRLSLRARLSAVIIQLATIRSEGNSALGIVLRTLAKTQRKLAEQTGEASDMKLAELAETRADMRDALQAEIDLRLSTADHERLEIESKIKQLNGTEKH